MTGVFGKQLPFPPGFPVGARKKALALARRKVYNYLIEESYI